jgi:hypothetical protein
MELKQLKTQVVTGYSLTTLSTSNDWAVNCLLLFGNIFKKRNVNNIISDRVSKIIMFG